MRMRHESTAAGLRALQMGGEIQPTLARKLPLVGQAIQVPSQSKLIDAVKYIAKSCSGAGSC
jgi:hypothetical protein